MFLLDGRASPLISEVDPGRPSYGSRDITIFGDPDDSVHILARMGERTSAVLVSGFDVFNSPGAFEPLASDYHKRSFDRQPLIFRTDPAQGAVLSVNGNGQSAVRMQTGQMQLWHIVNMAPGLVLELPSLPDFEWRVSAQDDLPLAWESFSAAANANASLTLAPGNRADLLVKAPPGPGMYAVNGSVRRLGGEPAARLLLNVEVVAKADSAMTKQPDGGTFLNASALYPYPQPARALADIASGEIAMSRKVVFADSPGGARGASEPVLRLAPAEEWTVVNTTSRQRVLHLPRSPFQVLEVFDPQTTTSPRLLPSPFGWADTILVPATSELSSLAAFVKIRFRGEQHNAVSPYVYRGGVLFRSNPSR